MGGAGEVKCIYIIAANGWCAQVCCVGCGCAGANRIDRNCAHSGAAGGIGSAGDDGSTGRVAGNDAVEGIQR